MRKNIVAGNWKMNKSLSEAKELVAQISNLKYDSNVELILFPPSLYVSEIANKLVDSTIEVGTQNCSEHDNGAFTGELSVEMIKSTNASYVIIGHSERRTYFNETNQLLAQKINKVLSENLTPIYCCGEQLNERESGSHFDVIKAQISEGLFHLNESKIINCIIAYEPVWAIGTGVTASSDQAQEMHAFIRKLLAEKYGEEIANSISILYGGSCKPSNSKELFSQSDIDGGLIGGASLNAADFIAIANSF
jgi:triosephosphate isomerase (TIM)